MAEWMEDIIRKPPMSAEWVETSSTDLKSENGILRATGIVAYIPSKPQYILRPAMIDIFVWTLIRGRVLIRSGPRLVNLNLSALQKVISTMMHRKHV